jgi:hypothetical protein
MIKAEIEQQQQQNLSPQKRSFATNFSEAAALSASRRLFHSNTPHW